MRGFVTMSGFISNDNGEQLIAGASRTLDNGSALIIFPEGTRTEPITPSTPLQLKFQRGAANIAVRAKRNITPVTITCHPATLSKQHKWYYVPPKKVVMRFIVHPDIAIEPYTHTPASTASRHLTRDLENYFTKTLQTGKTP
jgi:1-acyl-sn-glycerol-3-phosphate acyltransferase